MKKLAMITKTVVLTPDYNDGTGCTNFSKKEITIRFLGISIYKETTTVK
ncbi:hypothetical protein [Flavobacterium caseinilyticum]|nr:hypothetical protein [Flavobacterium caseinilyticum]